MATSFITAVSHNENSFIAAQQAAQDALHKSTDKKADFIIVFATDKYNQVEIVKGVKSVFPTIPLFGSATPTLFTESELSDNGVAIAIITSDSLKFFTGVGTNLEENADEAVQNALSSFPPEDKEYPYSAMLCLTDGKRTSIVEQVVLSIIRHHGPETKIAGGLSGTVPMLEGKPTVTASPVYDNNTNSENAIVLGELKSKKPVIVVAHHGYYALSPPLKITKIEGNKIVEIDNKPAFESWKQYATENSEAMGLPVDVGLLLLNTLGFRTNEGYKLKGIVGKEDNGAVQIISNPYEGMICNIMGATKDSLTEAARKTAEMALQAADETPIAGAIVFDCVSHSMVLKDNYEASLNEIRSVLKVPIIGFQTLGEYAVETGQISGYHDSATVILLIPS